MALAGRSTARRSRRSNDDRALPGHRGTGSRDHRDRRPGPAIHTRAGGICSPACRSAGIAFIRPLLVRSFGIDSLSHSSGRVTQSQIIGRRATVTRTVDSAGGQVRIGDGEFWSARSYDPDDLIPVGASAEVMVVDGLTALVSPVVPITLEDDSHTRRFKTTHNSQARKVHSTMGIEIVLGVLVLFVLLVGFKSIRLVPQARVVIVQRLGRYLKTAGSGPVFVIPFVDKLLPTIDLREQVVPFPPQAVITSDNVGIQVATVVYYQIIDAKNATYGVVDLVAAMEQLTITTLRNVIGGLTLDRALTSREDINSKMRAVAG